ncbi:hypothetical protein E1287_07570 [Actinomadura sp. KC06]|uniref:hypothetical protein n=1 Tax=Actinomadura sp. KC06 TaxID=2530369 RepID=UPI00104C1EE5|nr:hypothetical protein [Actinomadura sp. KC06]TDD37907.1 hypothetical protein E1287_07570 [Actinomadura sp. KC06]
MGARYALAVAAVGGLLFVASLVGSVAYTRYVAEQSAQQQAEERHRQDLLWCSLLGRLDQTDQPATTERGRAVQRDIHQLRQDLGCEGR